jgi:prolyl oligopeptidase
MCAALQDATASGQPVLIRQEPVLGHGVHARPARLSYFADVLAFFAGSLGPSVTRSGNDQRSADDQWDMTPD